MAETPLHGGLVGPTFACIIGIQFRNLRKCDRFWYENGNPLIRFTEAQLAEIRKITLSKVICDNCDQVTNVQSRDVNEPLQARGSTRSARKFRCSKVARLEIGSKIFGSIFARLEKCSKNFGSRSTLFENIRLEMLVSIKRANLQKNVSGICYYYII